MSEVFLRIRNQSFTKLKRPFEYVRLRRFSDVLGTQQTQTSGEVTDSRHDGTFLVKWRILEITQ